MARVSKAEKAQKMMRNLLGRDNQPEPPVIHSTQTGEVLKDAPPSAEYNFLGNFGYMHGKRDGNTFKSNDPSTVSGRFSGHVHVVLSPSAVRFQLVKDNRPILEFDAERSSMRIDEKMKLLAYADDEIFYLSWR